MSFEDKTLVCRDCGNEFVFTAGEQEFYVQKGFTNEPQRCRDCRQARKQRSASTSTDRPYSTGNGRSESYGRGGNEYGNISRGNEYAGGNEYDGNAAGGNEYDRGNTYDSMSRGNTYGAGRSSNTYARQERVQHETVCAQCGRPTTVPFVPRAGRPVYCQACFAQRRGPVAGRGASRDSGFNRF